MISRNNLIFFIGVSIPFIVITAYGVLFFYLNPRFFKNLDSLSLANMNLYGVPGQLWIIAMCYALPGFLISIFGILCYKESLRGSNGRFAFPLIILSGLSWASLGLHPSSLPIDDSKFTLLLCKIFITLFFGTLGFFLLAVQPKEIRFSLSTTIALYILIGAIVIESVTGLMYMTIYSIISYLAFFSAFAILGIHFKSSKSRIHGIIDITETDL